MAEARKLKVFLCHSSGDKPRVRDLYKRLLADGFEPWLDEEDLLPGQRWQEEIPRAVRAADMILVCLSRDSIAKDGYVQKEIKYALDAADEKPEGAIFIIPLRFEECRIPDRLAGWHAGSLYEERGYERLLRSLKARATELNLTTSASPVISQPLSPQPQSSPKYSVNSSLVLPPTFRNSIGMEFVLIRAGEFLMGSKKGSDASPVRRVQISKPFYLGKYQVTQEQWQKVMGNNPSRFAGDLNRPVEKVSWNDAQEFLRKLAERDQDRVYRLPTEAEWEYACRAGSTGEYCFGDDETILKEYAWYGEGEKGTTRPVGQLKSNAWGLYDMHGNVMEWVQDWYAADYYQGRPNPDVDPQGPEKGEARVLRGGSFRFSEVDACCAYRNGDLPYDRLDVLGFRVVVLPS